jgi:hypothetical protein
LKYLEIHSTFFQNIQKELRIRRKKCSLSTVTGDFKGDSISKNVIFCYDGDGWLRPKKMCVLARDMGD